MGCSKVEDNNGSPFSGVAADFMVSGGVREEDAAMKVSRVVDAQAADAELPVARKLNLNEDLNVAANVVLEPHAEAEKQSIQMITTLPPRPLS